MLLSASAYAKDGATEAIGYWGDRQREKCEQLYRFPKTCPTLEVMYRDYGIAVPYEYPNAPLWAHDLIATARANIQTFEVLRCRDRGEEDNFQILNDCYHLGRAASVGDDIIQDHRSQRVQSDEVVYF